MRSLLDALRNLRARAIRTSLTVAGIAIGVLALVVVGSLAERLHLIVARSTEFNAGTIFAIVERRVLTRSDAAAAVTAIGGRLRRLDGVAGIVPEVVLPYRFDGGDDGRFGPPSLIFGLPPQARTARTGLLTIALGRDLRDEDRRVAVIGADVATSERVRPGEIISLYGNSATVVGVLAKSFTLFDAAILVPFGDAQRLLLQSVPPTAERLPVGGITAFVVAGRPHVDAAVLTARINTVDGVRARDPAELAGAVRSTLGIFDAIVFGAAAIALLVGALSTVNTMATAVAERTREIGIRKAIGATDGAVLGELVLESGAIGALGGAAGIALGALVVVWLDGRSAAGGNLELFALSPRVAAGAFVFAVVLAALSGLAPAVAAARLEPTEALRR